MRIIHFLSSPSAGGAEIYVKDLAKAQSREGGQVKLVFLESSSEAGRDTDFEKRFLEELDCHGVGFSFVGPQARKSPWGGLLRLRKICKSFQPDVFHCHMYWGLVLLIFIKRPFLVVYTHHNILLRSPTWMYAFWNFVVDRYVAISELCKQTLDQVASRPISVIYNGVDLDRLHTVGQPDQSGASCKTVRLIAVGALSAQKNYKLMLDAVSRLNDLDFTLDIAGEGDQRAELERHICKEGLGGRVTLLGNVCDVRERLAAADLFLMSSAWEGLPIALIEASATGLPVLVTDVGGCREVIDGLGNGLVVNDLDASAFASSLRELIENADMRFNFSAAALKHRNVFSIENSAVGHAELYCKALASRNG